MRRVRRLAEVPTKYVEAAAAYCAALAPEEWNWDRFRDISDARPAVLAIKEALRSAQQGLCAYCEIQLPAGDLRQVQIEHVLPKGAQPAQPCRHLDPRNMLAACLGGTQAALQYRQGYEGHYEPPTRKNQCCGQAKGEAETIDPRTLPLLPRLFLIEDSTGCIYPDRTGCVQAGIDAQKLEADLMRLGLNCPRLKNLRARVIANLDEETQGLSPEQLESLMVTQLAPGLDGTVSRFWSTVRAFFDHRSEAWISRHRALLS